MNKTELIDKIAAEAGLTKADSKKALEATVSVIKAALAAGDKVQLVGFVLSPLLRSPLAMVSTPVQVRRSPSLQRRLPSSRLVLSLQRLSTSNLCL